MTTSIYYKKLKNSGCTPRLPGSLVYLMREDLLAICEGDQAQAHALRYFEIQTDARIKHIRNTYNLPSGIMPHPDDLWLDGNTHAMEHDTLHAQGRTSYNKVLNDTGAKSLVGRGFIQLRWIARPRINTRKRTLIIVENKAGEYRDSDGKRRNARLEGYRVMRQVLYKMDAVNAAIAALTGMVSEPWPRWSTPVTPQTQELGGVLPIRADKGLTSPSLAGNNRASQAQRSKKAFSMPELNPTPYHKNTISRDCRPQLDENAEQYLSLTECRLPLSVSASR